MFGKSYELKNNGSSKFNTAIGTAASVAVSILCVVIFFIFGEELYDKKHPAVSQSEIYDSNLKISVAELPLAFSFHLHDGSFIENINPYFELRLYMFTLRNGEVINITDPKPLVTCKKSKQIELMQVILGNHTHYCFDSSDQELFFSNPYGAMNSAFLQLQISKCKVNCASNIDIVTEEAYVRMNFINAYVDSQNFQSPIFYYADFYTQQIGNQLLKRTFFKFTNNILESDGGWVFEDKNVSNYISLREIRNDVNPSLEDQLYWVTFDSSYLHIKIVRSYMKMQELFAKVGGFFSAIKFISFLISAHYINYKYKYELLDCILDEESKLQNRLERPYFSHLINVHNQSKFIQGNSNLSISGNVNPKCNPKNEASEISPTHFNKMKHPNFNCSEDAHSGKTAPYLANYYSYIIHTVCCKSMKNSSCDKNSKIINYINSCLSIRNIIRYFLKNST